MVQYADPIILQRVAEAKKKMLDDWAEGISIPSRTGHALVEVRHRVVADRIALAASCRSRGSRLLQAQPPLYRDAISRFYYSTYHSFRALVYFGFGGDDHEKHSDLPSHLPADLPGLAIWANDLKSARETRNAADYDLYPKSENAWKSDALRLQTTAADALTAARSYLRMKGCNGI